MTTGLQLIYNYNANHEAEPERRELLYSAGSVAAIKVSLSLPVELECEVAYFSLDSFNTAAAFDDEAVEMARVFAQQIAVLLKRLELELTESAAMADITESVKILGSLRDLGVALAIDDFGTAYSSLAYLKQLPVHSLKVDQAFVKDLGRTGPTDDRTGGESIIRAVVALARSFGLTVVVEGVETEVQHQGSKRSAATRRKVTCLQNRNPQRKSRSFCGVRPTAPTPRLRPPTPLDPYPRDYSEVRGRRKSGLLRGASL